MDLQRRVSDYARTERSRLATMLTISSLGVTILGFVICIAVIDTLTKGNFSSTTAGIATAVGTALVVAAGLIMLLNFLSRGWLARMEQGAADVLRDSPAVLQIMTGQLPEVLPEAMRGAAGGDIISRIDLLSGQLDRLEPSLVEVGRRRIIWQAVVTFLMMLALSLMLFTEAGRSFSEKVPVTILMIILMGVMFGPAILRRISWRFLLAEEVGRRLAD